MPEIGRRSVPTPQTASCTTRVQQCVLNYTTPEFARLAGGGKRIRTLGPRYMDDAFETILVA